MGRISVRHLRKKGGGYYFEPNASMKRAGFHAEPLGKDLSKALERVERLNGAWDEVRDGRDEVVTSTTRRDTVAWLACEMRRSSEYHDKKPRTREELDYSLDKHILPLFGPTLLKRVEPEDVQRFYDYLRSTGSVHRAAKIMKWFRYLFHLAVRLDKVPKNPTLAVRIKQPKPRSQKWTPEQVVRAVDEARRQGRSCIACVILIGYDTSLREGDILASRRDQYDGESLFVTQAKTGSDHHAPLWPETVAAIEDELRRWPTALPRAPLIRGPHGRRYKKDNFTHLFRAICRAACIPDALQFRDLRRTASSERADAGATAPELASSSGHTIARSAKILDTYNPASYERAKNAQRKRRAHLSNENTKGPKVGKSPA